MKNHFPTEQPKTQSGNRFVNTIRPHRLFLTLVLVWTIFLGWNISKTGQWSAWINGDIQSILTLRYWSRDGFFKPHAFLLIPQGYTPFVSLFDGTDLEDHAQGSWYVKDGDLVRRIYYNHFPNFNLIPLAIVTSIAGSEHKFLFQLVQMFQSTIGFIFLYAFLYALFRSRIAASIASGSYIISNLYVDWVHATNIAVDDFFKYQLLFYSVIEKNACANYRKIISAVMWLTYFFMCLTTLESIVFGYAWIVGYDLFNDYRMRWKRWIVFASAAFLARAVQMIQSLVAFGWDGAMADWFGRWNTMANQDGRASILEHFLSISRELRYLIGFGWDKHRIIELHLLVIFFVAFTGLGLLLLAKNEKERCGSWWKTKALIPAILLIAGSGFGFIFPGASWMRYEGRQFIPFFTAMTAYLIVEWPTLKGKTLKKWVVLLLVVPIFGVIIRQTYLTITNIQKGTPTYSFGKYDDRFFQLGNEIHKNTDNRTSMVFILQQSADYIPFLPNPQFPKREGYALDAQIMYAADANILAYKDQTRLIQQLESVVEKTNGIVTPYVVADSAEGLTGIKNQLIKLGYSSTREEPDMLVPAQPWVGMEFKLNQR